MNKIYVVSTPIGNMSDISLRAIDVLKNVHCVLAENTKHTAFFLNKLRIKNKLVSLHKFNEISRVEEILKFLEIGDVALVSDAGTPTISDPGQLLLNKLMKRGILINTIPGPTALTSALSISGLIFKNFTFIGFMPKKVNQIKKVLLDHYNSEVIVAYESPKRINKTIKLFGEINPNMNITVARELTKIYEEVVSGTPYELKDFDFRGEIVVMISNFKQELKDDISSKIKFLLSEGMTNKSIVSYLTKTEEIKRNDVYERLKNYE